MREIKFRAWDKENKRMFEVDGLSFRNQYITDEAGQHTFKFNQCYLMQYTGLKDKNGKEIYEGDLIKDSDSSFIGEAIWDTETLCFTTKFQDNDLWGFVPRNGRDNHCEIIGNIYENPELLKGEISKVRFMMRIINETPAS